MFADITFLKFYKLFCTSQTCKPKNKIHYVVLASNIMQEK